MNCLMIVAHGSRNQASTDEIMALANTISALNTPFDQVSVAFLELAQPSIMESFEQCFNQASACDDVTVLPYFLSQGNHVSKDVPHAIQQATTR